MSRQETSPLEPDAARQILNADHVAPTGKKNIALRVAVAAVSIPVAAAGIYLLSREGNPQIPIPQPAALPAPSLEIFAPAELIPLDPPSLEPVLPTAPLPVPTEIPASVPTPDQTGLTISAPTPSQQHQPEQKPYQKNVSITQEQKPYQQNPLPTAEKKANKQDVFPTPELKTYQQPTQTADNSSPKPAIKTQQNEATINAAEETNQPEAGWGFGLSPDAAIQEASNIIGHDILGITDEIPEGTYVISDIEKVDILGITAMKIFIIGQGPLSGRTMTYVTLSDLEMGGKLRIGDRIEVGRTADNFIPLLPKPW